MGPAAQNLGEGTLPRLLCLSPRCNRGKAQEPGETIFPLVSASGVGPAAELVVGRRADVQNLRGRDSSSAFVPFPALQPGEGSGTRGNDPSPTFRAGVEASGRGAAAST
ncbi:hypothetical protein GOSPT_103_00770 [Gordonia sputi NBRC 100414]|uniref:Uncharacterized protein n=1 Tax=Gordonia sputi NBRC 100414 TaxID=1089453 RepID=H5U442_9ACTN|nr:hypothetical protein GOSPT_103_00770 [Gordonia sputi NBRC 100414]